jgi:hypothetical protein
MQILFIGFFFKFFVKIGLSGRPKGEKNGKKER